MQIPIRIEIVLPTLVGTLVRDQLTTADASRLFPNTLQRMVDLANLGASRWKEKVTRIPGAEGRPLVMGTGPSNPMVRLDRGRYIDSVQVGDAHAMADGFGVTVAPIDKEQAQAEAIEYGGELIDLHVMLNYAPKARVGKKGKYLRIPFRHATTAAGGPGGQRFQGSGATVGDGVLTPGILRAMANKPRYLHTKYLGQIPSQTQPGQKIRKFLYSPAKLSQLTRAEIDAVNARAKTHKISTQYARNLTGLMHVGKKGHGHYLTIRTLSQAKPKGWRIQAYPAQGIADATANEIRQLAETWFEDSMRADMMGIGMAA